MQKLKIQFLSYLSQNPSANRHRCEQPMTYPAWAEVTFNTTESAPGQCSPKQQSFLTLQPEVQPIVLSAHLHSKLLHKPFVHHRQSLSSFLASDPSPLLYSKLHSTPNACVSMKLSLAAQFPPAPAESNAPLPRFAPPLQNNPSGF